jgi:cytochrome c-type biogenesis protein CcmE
LFNAAEDMSTYATFSEAIKNESTVKIAGNLSKDKKMDYNPEKDPNYFSFFIKDSKGMEKKSFYLLRSLRILNYQNKSLSRGR